MASVGWYYDTLLGRGLDVIHVKLVDCPDTMLGNGWDCDVPQKLSDLNLDKLVHCPRLGESLGKGPDCDVPQKKYVLTLD